MPFSLRSIVLFSSLMAASALVFGVAAVPVPSDPAEPVVTPAPVLTPAPDDCAVPALLVPGGEASLDEFAEPLGSSPALFNPPGFAGPDGMPLTPDVPAPAEPAFGEPAALLLPADGPMEFWADEAAGKIRTAIAARTAARALFIGKLLYRATTAARPCSDWNDFRRHGLHGHPLDAWSRLRLRKLIAFDDDTLDARDRMATFQELADEAFADVLKKHGVPIDLRDALRKSAAASNAATTKTRSKIRRTTS